MKNASSSGTMAGGAWWRSLTREHWVVFVGASLAWLFDCLDSQLFNLARDGAMEDLLRDRAKATIMAPYTTSVFLLGWAVGGLIFGALGDRFGRAKILSVTILLYSISTGLNAFATTFTDFCVYRFITGLGVGGVFGLAVALVADTVDDRARPPALGLLQSLSTWGNLAAGLIGMAIGAMAARELLPFGLKPWQTLFIVGALPAFLCVFVIRRIKEPMKWVRAREDGARRGIRFGSYAALLGHARWRKHAWLGLIACSSGIIGLWGIGNFHPKIVGSIIEHELAARQLTAEAMASEKAFWRAAGLLLQNIGGFLGMMSLARFAQVKGRRVAFALALLLSFLSTVLALNICGRRARCIGCFRSWASGSCRCSASLPCICRSFFRRACGARARAFATTSGGSLRRRRRSRLRKSRKVSAATWRVFARRDCG
jgi:MFS family permease